MITRERCARNGTVNTRNPWAFEGPADDGDNVARFTVGDVAYGETLSEIAGHRVEKRHCRGNWGVLGGCT